MSADALLVNLESLAQKSTEKLDLYDYALSGDNLIKMAIILLRHSLWRNRMWQGNCFNIIVF